MDRLESFLARKLSIQKIHMLLEVLVCLSVCLSELGGMTACLPAPEPCNEGSRVAMRSP